ncbi:MAG: DMT family transporter [Gemmatimonadaceae bacterium]|nr:DMT family transporter [Gemmatimonadaceae bacterium]
MKSELRPGFGATDGMLMLMAAIWGANFTVVKYATQALEPLAFNGVRVLIAAVALSVLAVAGPRARPTGRDMLVLLALGVIGNGFYQIFFVEGVARTRPGDASLVLGAAPAFIALLGRITGVERISMRGAVGVALSIAGVALVVFGAPQVARGTMQSTLLGNVLVLGGALCWAVYTILLKPYTHRIDGIQLSAVTMVGGAVLLGAFALPDVARTDWTRVDGLTWAAIGYSSIGALVIAYLFWYRGVRTLGPTRTAMYSNLQPVIALLVAWMAFGDRPGFVQVAGVSIITTGLVLTRT